MPTFAPARILRDRFATTNEPESAIRHRLERFLGQLRQKAAPLPDPDGTPEADGFDLSGLGLSTTDRARIRARARRFVQRRDALPKPDLCRAYSPHMMRRISGGFIAVWLIVEGAPFYLLTPYYPRGGCRFRRAPCL